MTRNIANPLHSLVTARQDTVSLEVMRSYHFAASHILEFCEYEPGRYSISEIRHTGEIRDFLLAPFLAQIYIERDEAPTIVAGKNLAKAYDLIEKNRSTQVRNLFQESFENLEQVERFVDALVHPLTRLSLVAFMHRNQTEMPKSSGFSVIASDQDIWLLMPENQNLDSVRVKSVTKMELEETINSFLPKQELAQ
jgi:hypothetical protein